MMLSLVPVITVIILAWGYDFWNGANDRANSIATTVSAKALSFKQATLLAGFFNLAGAFITTEVAKTIGKGIVSPKIISQPLLIFSLIGAIIWVVASTRLGIPISVTHSLVGGLIGAGLVKAGFMVLNKGGLIKVMIGMVLAPVVGFAAAFVLILILVWLVKLLFSNISGFKLNQFFRKSQILTTVAISLSHGMNDTQNAMGVITASLLAGGFLSEFEVPIWVILGSGFFMALGTIWKGKKVMRTVGRKIYKVKPVHGISAEASSAVVIGIESLLGVPLSTTQVISSGVMGVGTAERRAEVKWREIIRIFFTWVFTIPGAAIISGLLFWIFLEIV